LEPGSLIPRGDVSRATRDPGRKTELGFGTLQEGAFFFLWEGFPKSSAETTPWAASPEQAWVQDLWGDGAPVKIGPGVIEVVVIALVYLTGVLWIFLITRDVVRTRRKSPKPVSVAWNLVAVWFPIGTLIWILYRRDLMTRQKPSQSA